ncbi:MAG TPA: VCBS repeat-containing protein [Candidatus Paceibacterota bacterium]|nr:VCBS repeat-containing protein [Verrucomicrobiota bacterium]HRY47186.1 VCBS repeat-containing protein [Candidatus Paceibacterota bacterium]
MTRDACVRFGVGCALLTFGWLVSDPLCAAENPAWQTARDYRCAALPIPTQGQPGFTPIPGSRTGITFTNSLPIRLMMENNNFMNGSGVAAGDFDGDGRCDLYLCAIDGTNALYRNLGDWRFERIPSDAQIGCPGLHSTGALWADLDGDGDLDLLVATLGNGVHSFVNQGGGQFRENTAEAGLISQTGSTSLAMADVDGDADLDLYVANYGAVSLLRSGGRAEVKLVNGQWVFTGPYAKRLRLVDGRVEEVGEADVLYLNDGRGRFRPVPWGSEFFLDEEGKPKPPPLDYGLTVQIRDINGDRTPDIYVCNDFQTVDRIWLNDGTGHFRALPRLSMRKQSFSSMGVDFADIDRDGFLDFFTTEMIGREHSRRMRDIVGMQPLAPFPGRIDNRPEVARNTLFHNRGDTTYSEIANYSGVAASDWTWQPVFLDVDLDGYEDLLVVNGMPFNVQDRDTLDRIRQLGKQTPEQSRTNLALYPPFRTANVAYRNRRDLTFEDMSQTWGFNSPEVSQGMALADLDGDGDLDAAINCLNAPPLLYRNNGTAPRIAVRLKGKRPNRHGTGASVRVFSDSMPAQAQEILCGGHYLSCDDPMRVFAVPSESRSLRIEVLWRSGLRSLIANAKPNHLYEIDEETAFAHPASPPSAPLSQPLFRDVSHWLNHVHHDEFFVDYARQPLLMKQFSQLGPGVAWWDLDGDDRDELIVGAGKGGILGAFRQTPSGAYEKISASPAWTTPDDLCGLAGWTTDDGHPAILLAVANYESEAASSNTLFLCALDDSTGQLQPRALADIAASPASPGPLAVADIEGDGDLDLFVGGRLLKGAYPQAASSSLFRREPNRWIPDPASKALFENIGLVSGAVWSDLDADGFPELILACEWGPVRVFRNHKGHLSDATGELGLASFAGWWNGVTTGDLDEDGQLDILATNWGLNDAYQATSERPLRLYYGDLHSSGTMDLIEAYYPAEMSVEVPRRALNALSRAFPILLESFPTHEAFSQATMQDLLGLLPRKPQAVTAVTLVTTVFLNRRTNFVAVPFPSEAQFAPAFGVNVADADGDGHEDVFLSQNFFAVRPEWYRMDAGRGLWLRGDGKGSLKSISGQESGIQVYGEQRGSALADFNRDGRVDLVVTQNGAATRLFENVGARPGLRIRLKGPPGNPAGIGAILRLHFAQRAGPAREVHGGAGYGSQDSPVQVLGCPEPPTRIQITWPGGKVVQSELPPFTPGAEITVDSQGKTRFVESQMP